MDSVQHACSVEFFALNIFVRLGMKLHLIHHHHNRMYVYVPFQITMSDTAISTPMSKLNADVSSPEMSESSPSNEPSSPPASPDTKYPMSERVSPFNQPDSPFFAVLQSRALWRQFSAVRTEMIVTRRGR